MTDSDLAAIATYLKSVPGRADHPAAGAGERPRHGRRTGDLSRSMLGLPRAGRARGAATVPVARRILRWSAPATPTTLIRLVLRGARSVATAAEPTSPGHAVLRRATRRCPGRRRRDLHPQCVEADRAGGIRRRCAQRPVDPERTNRLVPCGALEGSIRAPGTVGSERKDVARGDK